ncbi:MAG: cupin domain-containing protein [Chloroflexi bacterium]|nr:cupin domain-containing protein [Chloroflexota bacterium]MBI3930917.1 cupin domain-containing protein [Chloroflexota bacterium]
MAVKLFTGDLREKKAIYDEFLDEEGIPVHRAIAGVEDVKELPRGKWARMGGRGTYVVIEGVRQEGSGLYVAEIPGGGALEPEKHMYDELIYILQGRGLAEVWQEGGPKRTFEWGKGSLFAMPTNAWHRLMNGGREPVLFFAKTNAPTVMKAFRNTDFIFNCDHKFTDRFGGEADYFIASKEARTREGPRTFWTTNFVPDLLSMVYDDMPEKVEGGQLTFFRMSSWEYNHTSGWPAGVYHMAHYHGPGALLLGLSGEGYALIWPKRCGPHPYRDGYGDQVVKANWKEGSIYSPYGEYGMWGESFHQHFNTGKVEARHLAMQNSTDSRRGALAERRTTGEHKNIRDGGGNLAYEDEDPEIRRQFIAALKKNGVKFTMKPVVYRTDVDVLKSKIRW